MARQVLSRRRVGQKVVVLRNNLPRPYATRITVVRTRKDWSEPFMPRYGLANGPDADESELMSHRLWRRKGGGRLPDKPPPPPPPTEQVRIHPVVYRRVASSTPPNRLSLSPSWRPSAL